METKSGSKPNETTVIHEKESIRAAPRSDQEKCCWNRLPTDRWTVFQVWRTGFQGWRTAKQHRPQLSGKTGDLLTEHALRKQIRAAMDDL
eukprot:647484-Amphidinium_carterae.1